LFKKTGKAVKTAILLLNNALYCAHSNAAFVVTESKNSS